MDAHEQETSSSAAQAFPRRTPLGMHALREIAAVPRRGAIRRYAFALLLSAIALLLTVAFEAWLSRSIFLLFWPVIIAIAWFSGFGPAVTASVLAVFAVDTFFVPPAGVMKLPEPTDMITLAVFLSTAVLTSWVVSRAERAHLDAAEAATVNAALARQLDEQSAELAQQLEESQAMQEELEVSSEELLERTAEAEAANTFTRSVLESISDPFVVHDANWRFRYVNAAAARAFAASSLPHRDVEGQVLWDVWPDIRGTIFETEMRRAVTECVPVSFEAYYPQEARWSEVHCYPLPDGGIGTQWKDITDRKRSQEAAHYLERATELMASSLDYEYTLAELARLIVPHFADWCAVSIVGDDGIPRQLAVAHVDPDKVKWAHELHRRYPPDNSALTGVPQVIRSGKPELYPEIPEELLVAGAIDEEHLRISRELGLRSAMVVPLATADRTFGAITIVAAESGRRYDEDDLDLALELARRAALAVDNSLHHKAEMDARLAAESANQAKTQFLAVMSHELRTPLNAIGGYAELLLMGLRGPLTPDQKADLDRIQRSQRNLLSLINDILNYAKIDAGHVEFAMDYVRLHPLLQEIEPLVRPQLQARGLSYDFSGCSDGLVVWADADKVRQILLNLLSNAIKFTPAAGSITLDCVDAEDTVKVLVCDTGVGIPPDKIASIFEPFVQLERKLSSTHDGTGLGLAISRDLARGMSGELSVVSKPGSGSTFELSLRKGPV